MRQKETTHSRESTPAGGLTFVGGGVMGALVRTHEWTASPLGPISTWPPSLRVTVSLCLNSKFPTVIFWGPDAVMLYNDAYLPMLADKHPTALGQSGHACWPEIWSIVGPMLENVLATGEATWSYDLLLPIRHNGAVREHYFTFSYSPIRDEEGTVCGVFCPVTETTERVERERRERVLRQEAEAAQAHLRATLESITDGFYALDREWRFIYVNQRAKALMGRPQDDFIGKCVWEEFPESEQQIFGRCVRQAMTEQVTTECEDWYEPWLAWITMRVYPSADGVAVYFHDITERKQNEEALAQHARDLVRAHADLRQVAYVSAHDLQEPVRQVGIFTQRIAQRYQATLDPDIQEAITFVVEGTHRLQAQFTDLLHYLEIEEPGMGMAMTNCETVLQHVLEALHEPIAMSGATITHEPLPMLVANAKHLQLLLQELIDNAVKFHDAAPPQVHVWAERETNGWRFAVRDNGIGIEPAAMSQLFRFFRKLQRRTDYPGTGMGLAICKKIVERHAGRIWVESQIGKGTTVFFTIGDVHRRYGRGRRQ